VWAQNTKFLGGVSANDLGKGPFLLKEGQKNTTPCTFLKNVQHLRAEWEWKRQLNGGASSHRCNPSKTQQKADITQLENAKKKRGKNKDTDQSELAKTFLEVLSVKKKKVRKEESEHV